MNLRHRLAEMQLLSETRAVQIEDLRAETVRLSLEINRRELVKLGTESGGDHDFGHGREAEAASGEISAALDTNSQKSEKAETPAWDEIMILRHDAEEKNLLLASRNEELMRVKAEMDLLQGELSKLKASIKRIQESAKTECAEMRSEFQAQVAFLQAELSQRDWTLQEREAAQKVLEQGLRAKIGQLEAQREQVKTSTEGPAQEFVLGVNWESEARLDDTWKLQERLDGNGAEIAQTASNQSGKWRNSGAWKRRWRSR